jgi:hypothetical protein
MEKKKENKRFIYMVNEFLQVICKEVVDKMIENEQDMRLEISRHD